MSETSLSVNAPEEGEAASRPGVDFVRAAIMEDNASGRFGGNVYILHEISKTPDVQPLPGFPSTAEPPTAEPSTENPPQLKKDLICNALKPGWKIWVR